VTVPGKKLVAPVTRATIVKRSFMLEHYLSTLDQSDVFTGVRFGRMGLAMPPTGLATITLGGMGQDGQIMSAANAPYLTGPAAATSTGLLAAVNGTLRVGSDDVAVVTGFNLNIDLSPATQPVVGSNLSPDVFMARTVINGDLSFVVENITMLNNFINEDSIEVALKLTEAETAPESFLKIFLPKVKFTGSNRDIGNAGPIIVAQPFQALLPAVVSGYDQSSIVIQDSEV
jgi:hypothetical protein